MNVRLSLAGPMAAGLLLAACSTPQGYPSLAIPKHGRVTGTMQPVETPPFTPSPPAPVTLTQVDNLMAEAHGAHQAFLAAIPAAQASAEAATAAEPGSDKWSDAQVDIANLETLRARAMIALADLDRLYADAAVGGHTIARLGAARSEVAALVDSENATVSRLLALAGSSPR